MRKEQNYTRSRSSYTTPVRFPQEHVLSLQQHTNALHKETTQKSGQKKHSSCSDRKAKANVDTEEYQRISSNLSSGVIILEERLAREQNATTHAWMLIDLAHWKHSGSGCAQDHPAEVLPTSTHRPCPVQPLVARHSGMTRGEGQP